MHRTVLCVFLAFVCCCLMNCCVDGISKPKDKNDILLDKLQQLSDWSGRKPIIRMDNKKFQTYVKQKPRNYSVVMMLTTLHSHRQCAMCHQAKDEFDVVANSWRFSQNYADGLVYFAMADFDEASDIFTSLSVNTVPQIMHFSPNSKQKRGNLMDLYRTGFHAEAIVRFVLEHTGVQIQIVRPPDYTTIGLYFALAFGVAIVIYIKRDDLTFFCNRSAWGTLSLVTMMLLTSGQMWNHIRGAQFYEKDQQSGQTVYVHPWADSQFIAETYIIFALYVAVVGGFILLNEAKFMKATVGKRRVVALAAVAAIVFFFSELLSIFKSKHHGYPYSFLLQ